MQRLSVAIITLNATRSLAQCLQSVTFADEIVVVDSGSQDGTVDIAKRFGARVIHHDWQGFGRQKQFAVGQASSPWVLCLDADEWVSDQLKSDIQWALESPRFEAYRIPRCNRFMGRWLRHGEGYPDYSLRLFNRHKARWSEAEIHEQVIVSGGEVGLLTGDLMHESEDGIAEYLAKQNRYTTLQAEQLYNAGKRVNMVVMLGSPILRFVKFYVIRRGFLDGLPGLVHISIGCFNSFIKYAKLAAKLRLSG
jgi:glycosyltransferase involved in cell wall biosynthesis